MYDMYASLELLSIKPIYFQLSFSKIKNVHRSYSSVAGIIVRSGIWNVFLIIFGISKQFRANIQKSNKKYITHRIENSQLFVRLL